MTTDIEITLDPENNERLVNLCGYLDEHLKMMASRLGVAINNRGALFKLSGAPEDVHTCAELLRNLYKETAQNTLAPDDIHLALQQASVEQLGKEGIPQAIIRTRRNQIKARGKSQVNYIEGIRNNDLCFGVGPAGTGKTYLAVACAVEALESDRVRRIILVRPAVEAGEKLGFLPGDLAQKVDPYLRPMYDALYEMLGFDKVAKLIERNVIEVAPLAYMRGRTLNESFIVMDEAQNTTIEQMKMFLTRIGFGSTAVVTGDMTQTDLPSKTTSGLRHCLGILEGIKGVSINHFKSKDVVRHPLVKRIVDAYDAHEH